jgi:lipopolysaccharide export system protein LptA
MGNVLRDVRVLRSERIQSGSKQDDSGSNRGDAMERATLTPRPRSRQSRSILLGVLSAIAVVSVAAAQIPSVTRPMQVQAETTSFDSSARSALWSGHVRVEFPACRLSSDTFRVNYGDDLHDVKTARADGSVRIDQGTRWFTGRDALLDTSSRTIVLTGSPTMHEFGSQTNARKITIHLDTDQNVIE